MTHPGDTTPDHRDTDGPEDIEAIMADLDALRRETAASFVEDALRAPRAVCRPAAPRRAWRTVAAAALVAMAIGGSLVLHGDASAPPPADPDHPRSRDAEEDATAWLFALDDAAFTIERRDSKPATDRREYDVVTLSGRDRPRILLLEKDR
jgi:hypothetical protein